MYPTITLTLTLAPSVTLILIYFKIQSATIWNITYAIDDQNLTLVLFFQATMQVIKTHHSNPEILAPACGCLGHLADNDDNLVTIAAAGGIQVQITTFPLLPLQSLFTHNPKLSFQDPTRIL